MAERSTFVVVALYLIRFQKVCAEAEANEIEAKLYAVGWPPSVVTISWTSQIKERAVEYNLFYGRSGDFGCQNMTANLLNAAWCKRNASQFNAQRQFQCDITRAYTKLDIFEYRSYYNLCVIIIANTSSGLHYQSNMLDEELATTTVCPAPNVTLHPGKRNIIVAWNCPYGVNRSNCRNCIFFKVLLTRTISGRNQCVDQPKSVDTAFQTVFTDLEPDSSYNVTVCCNVQHCLVLEPESCNCDHMGPPTIGIVTTKEDVPENPPERLTCRAKCSKENMAVDLTYRAPPESSWNGIPLNYRVTYWDLSSPANRTSKTFPFSGEETPITLTGLDVEARYSVETCLSTSAGCGPVATSTIGCELCLGILPTTPVATTAPSSPNPWTTSSMMVLLITAPLTLLVFLLICCCMHRRESSKSKPDLSGFEVEVNEAPYPLLRERGEQVSDDYNPVTV